MIFYKSQYHICKSSSSSTVLMAPLKSRRNLNLRHMLERFSQSVHIKESPAFHLRGTLRKDYISAMAPTQTTFYFALTGVMFLLTQKNLAKTDVEFLIKKCSQSTGSCLRHVVVLIHREQTYQLSLLYILSK